MGMEVRRWKNAGSFGRSLPCQGGALESGSVHEYMKLISPFRPFDVLPSYP